MKNEYSFTAKSEILPPENIPDIEQTINSYLYLENRGIVIVRGPKALFRVNLALASIQCFIIDSIAPGSPASKSARCKAITLWEIELFTF